MIQTIHIGHLLRETVTSPYRNLVTRPTGAAIRNSEQQVWWPGGPSDPNVRVIRFEPKLAEYWDGPASSAVAAFEFAHARATGEKPNLGENRKVTVDEMTERTGSGA